MEPETDNQFCITYRVMVRIKIDDTDIIGVGEATELGIKEEAIALAKKNAVASARKDAFRKITIIAMPSGKIGFHVSEPVSYQQQEPSEADLLAHDPPGNIVSE
jgi:hypothetical protein